MFQYIEFFIATNEFRVLFCSIGRGSMVKIAINFDRQLDEETYHLVEGLAKTRRMKRDVKILSSMVP